MACDEGLPTDDQRQEQLEAGNIEGERGDSDNAVSRRKARRLRHRQQEVAQRAMANLHALGLARRARSEDHVGRICIRHDGQSSVTSSSSHFVKESLQFQHAMFTRFQHRPACSIAEDGGDAGTIEDLAQARRRHRHVEGHIGATGAPHANHGSHGHRRAVHRNGDASARRDTRCHEPAGDLAGACIELAIGEAFRLIRHGRRIGGLAGLRGDHRRDRLREIVVTLGRIQLVAKVVNLGFAQQRQCRNRRFWHRGRSPQARFRSSRANAATVDSS